MFNAEIKCKTGAAFISLMRCRWNFCLITKQKNYHWRQFFKEANFYKELCPFVRIRKLC